MIVAVLAVLSALLTAAITPLVRAAALGLNIVDHPGPRKIHASPVPRLGGVAVVISAATALAVVALLAPRFGWPAIAPQGELGPLILAAALVFAIGLWDDIRRVPPWTKLAVECLAALIVIRSRVIIDHATIFGRTYDFGEWSVVLTLVWILTVTNAFNLIDGLDGLSAGLAAIAAATCVTILIIRGHRPEALLLVSFVGALNAFLLYNFHPASIFLGDSGSLVLGFVLGVTAITGYQKVATALAAGLPLLIFALPIIDVVASVVRRAIRRSASGAPESLLVAVRRVFQPDQGHIHHRLLGIGFSHSGAVLLLYGLAIALSAVALFTFQME